MKEINGPAFFAQRKRKERLLDATEVRLLILTVLAQRPAHGYEIIKAIEELSRGEYTPSPSLVYPNLTLMEEMGYIQAAETDGKKNHLITAEGEAYLAQQQPQLEAVMARLASLAVLANNRSKPEVQRAIHNMKMALNTRLADEALSQQALYAIVDVLDEAAKKIERS
ncbi:PadR family transcriptional regulator [Mixta gaviniae]|uniref:Transcriptional regulator n=1 Tax=Mixta gaviniae TaxID=665914 RepID=A0A1X1DXB1_9GAMM|nr:PadR family transcriptional regulator [Mixta gaviniae]AUX94694.1 transcriptional regulator [Mixta gaviniae]ORM81325.1 transcriptional regulator [Mixta gaviniae]